MCVCVCDAFGGVREDGDQRSSREFPVCSSPSFGRLSPVGVRAPFSFGPGGHPSPPLATFIACDAIT